jgi:hypothetical protein
VTVRWLIGVVEGAGPWILAAGVMHSRTKANVVGRMKSIEASDFTASVRIFMNFSQVLFVPRVSDTRAKSCRAAQKFMNDWPAKIEYASSVCMPWSTFGNSGGQTLRFPKCLLSVLSPPVQARFRSSHAG